MLAFPEICSIDHKSSIFNVLTIKIDLKKSWVNMSKTSSVPKRKPNKENYDKIFWLSRDRNIAVIVFFHLLDIELNQCPIGCFLLSSFKIFKSNFLQLKFSISSYDSG